MKKEGCINLVSTEQKLHLVNLLREDNKKNRMQLHRREQIIYGTSIGDTYEKDEEDYLGTKEISSYKGKGISGFRIRFMISVILFLSFFYMDRSQEKIAGIGTEQIGIYIEENGIVSLVSNVFDFSE